MYSHKRSFVLSAIFVGLMIAPNVLKADYYKQGFFPIGLTGLNYTGYNPPYGDVGPRWGWDESVNEDYNEKALIEALGANCIGSQDAHPYYLINWGNSSASNYLTKVCKPLTDGGDTVLLITASYSSRVKYYLCDTDTFISGNPPETTIVYNVDCDDYSYDHMVNGGSINAQIPTSAFYRSPYRGGPDGGEQDGYGAMQFSSYDDGTYNCHGTQVDNWQCFDGDGAWCGMADTAVLNFQNYLDDNPSHADYIWGWNLFTEDPAVDRRSTQQEYLNAGWHGCWAANNRILRGCNSDFYITNRSEHLSFDPPSWQKGYRGAEESELGEYRMVIAKAGVSTLCRMDYNIFAELPDVDAFVIYAEPWCRAKWNYGEQELFDSYLYGDNATYGNVIGGPKWKRGYHNSAIYFQRYGDTPGGPSGQERRWIAAPGLQWRLYFDDEPNRYTATCRRPCPPEIRCASYLAFSRGAKGILYHGWSFMTQYDSDGDEVVDTEYPLPKVEIPDTAWERWNHDKYYNMGIRDEKGYPYGDDGSPDYSNHLLNDGPRSGYDSTYWHGTNERKDHTYYYLDTLFAEIKLLASKLIELDWVNGYSLNSTDPNWASPCPHDYVMEVRGVSYMDLGLFDHPYEPVGIEYFMLVNREGIVDMTNRTVTVALDAGHWPEEDTLILTDIANSDRPRRLSREGDRFTFTDVFEPGEGKLYRAAPVNEAPVTLLNR